MKQVIYKEFGKLKCTPEWNYNAYIRNARLIQDCGDFDSPMEIIEYYRKWFGCKPEDFIVKV